MIPRLLFTITYASDVYHHSCCEHHILLINHHNPVSFHSWWVGWLILALTELHYLSLISRLIPERHHFSLSSVMKLRHIFSCLPSLPLPSTMSCSYAFNPARSALTSFNMIIPSHSRTARFIIGPLNLRLLLIRTKYDKHRLLTNSTMQVWDWSDLQITYVSVRWTWVKLPAFSHFPKCWESGNNLSIITVSP